MRYALISDIHANLPALEAVLADVAQQPGHPATYHFGDLVGYAPWANETVALIRQSGIAGVAGNYDSTVATDYKHCGCRYEDPHQEALSHESYSWTRTHVSAPTKSFLCATRSRRRSEPSSWFWSVRRFPSREVWPYIGAQCFGAVVAAALLRLLLGPIGDLGATVPAIGVGRAFALEWVLSFGLMLVVAAVATDRRVPDGLAAVAVGLTVGFCALLGPLTGSSMNPARSFGPALVGGQWAGHWLYWVAPITGMMAAARLYDFLRHTEGPGAAREPTVTGFKATSRCASQRPAHRSFA